MADHQKSRLLNLFCRFSVKKRIWKRNFYVGFPYRGGIHLPRGHPENQKAGLIVLMGTFFCYFSNFWHLLEKFKHSYCFLSFKLIKLRSESFKLSPEEWFGKQPFAPLKINKHTIFSETCHLQGTTFLILFFYFGPKNAFLGLRFFSNKTKKIV